MSKESEMMEMRRELARMQREINQRPLAPGWTATRVSRFIVTGGNTLDDGVTLGIKRSLSLISSVPSAYNPDVDTTFIDGIGRGQMVVDNVTQSGFVLIVNDTRSGIPAALVSTDRCMSYGAVGIPVSGDPNGATVTCYIPYFN